MRLNHTSDKWYLIIIIDCNQYNCLELIFEKRNIIKSTQTQ